MRRWVILLLLICWTTVGEGAGQPALSGQVILITGASGDIGLQTAVRCLEAGASVVAHYNKNPGRLTELQKKHPHALKLILADFTDPKGAEHLWQAALAWKNRVDVVINSAGIEQQAKSTEDLYPAMLKTMAINYFGPVMVCAQALQHFQEKQIAGVIVNIGSRAAFRGLPEGYFHYADSKAALTRYTQQVAREYADRGIMAVVIAPGPVEGQMFNNIDAAVREKCLESLPTKKPVKLEEVTNAIMFYVTRQAPSGTGGVLDLMGASWFH